MVRYLGLDYLQNALDKRKQFLDKALLAIPNHLEHIDEYVHHGQLKDLKYRQPWIRAMCDKKFLENESRKCIKEFLEIKLEDTQFIEPLESLDIEEHGNFDLYEYVPSSNPGSQELCVDLDFIIKSDKVAPLHHTGHKELFEKENITWWSASPDCNNIYLEELYSSDYLRDTCKQIPGSHALLSRLNIKQIEDPFIVTDDGNFKWNILQSLEEFSVESNLVENTDTEFVKFREDIDKVKLTVSDGTLEQCLSPYIKQKNEENLSDLYTRETFVSQKQEELIYQDNGCNLDVILKNKNGEKLKETPENTVFSPYEIHKASFLEINILGEDKDDVFVTKSLLDSPITNAVLTSDKGTLAKNQLHLRPFHIPTETLRVLTPKDKYKLEKKFRDREKIYNDILALQLPDTETNQNYDVRNLVCEAKIELALTKVEEIGKLELTLSWDALSFNSSRMFKHRDIESFEGLLLPLMSTKISKEEFEKYSDIDMHGWQDIRLNGSLRKPIVKDKTNDVEQGISEEKSLKRSNGNECIQKKKTDGVRDKNDLNFDPLNSFLFMRSHNQILTTSNKDFFPQESERKKTKDNPSISKFVKPDRKKSKCKTVSIELSGEFKEVLRMIEKTAEYFLTTLKEAGDLLSTHELKTLTPDITRFLLKQREKYLQDNDQDGIGDTCYRAIIAIHALCGASEILTHCCLESAIAHLTAMQEKYQKFLKESLERIRQDLFKMQCNLHQDRVFHPKVFTLCQKIEAKIKKSLCASPDSEQKVLIIVKRDLQSLMECLKDAVCNGGIVRASIQTNDEHNSIIKSLDDFNCLIMFAGNIKEDFPWTQFSFVVEYERDDSEKFSSLCQRLNIRYLTIVITDKSVQDNASTSNWNEKKSNYSQITVIGSVKLTTQPDLLHILETRYNLLILERDFSLVKSQVQQVFADLIIDERTCVVLHPISELSEEYQLEPFASKLVCLSVKYSVCWIIFYHKGFKRYPYSNCTVSNVSKLHATVANLVSKTKEFSVKILTTSSVIETATIIRNICEISVKLSPVWKQKDWENRQWISEEMQQSETLLLTIPCMNSFCAQLMLQNAPLNTLLRMSYEELSRRFPWIPTKVLMIFFQLLNSNTGLGLRRCQSKDSIETNGSSDTSLYNTEEKFFSSDILSYQTQSENTSSSNQTYKDTKPSLSFNITGSNNAYLDKGKEHNVGFGFRKNVDMQIAEDEFSEGRSEVLCSNDFYEQNSKNVLFDKNCINPEIQVYERCRDENHHRMNLSQDSAGNDRFSLSSFQSLKPNEYVKAEMEGRQLKQGQNQYIIGNHLLDNQSNFNSDITQNPFLDQRGQQQRVPISFVMPQESPREITQNHHTNDQHSPISMDVPQPVVDGDNKKDFILGKRMSEPIRNAHLQNKNLPSRYSISLDEEHSQFNDINKTDKRNIPTCIDNDYRTKVLKTESTGFCSDVFSLNTKSSGLTFYHPPSNLSSQSQYFNDDAYKISKPILDHHMHQNFHEMKESLHDNGVKLFHENNGFQNKLPNTQLHTNSFPAQYSFSMDEEHAQYPSIIMSDKRWDFYNNPSVYHGNNQYFTQYQHEGPETCKNDFTADATYHQQSRNFVNDLSQTTRNILKHACQNKHFRPPVHRISIGLAQPQPRKNPETDAEQKEEKSQLNTSTTNIRPKENVTVGIKNQNTQLNKSKCSRTDEHQKIICKDTLLQDRQETDTVIYNEGNRKGKLVNNQKDSGSGYEQSLWSSYDSPPMDLDSDTLQFSSDSNLMDIQNSTEKTLKHQLNSTRQMENNGYKNRMVFKTNHSTPRKKRKLTYHKTPGCKGGQTKLVFQ